MSTLLSMTRDEIMPMVWVAQTDKIEINVFIEEKTDALIVAGRNNEKDCELGFAITYASIVDGNYRNALRPCLQQLVFLLEHAEHPLFPKDHPSWLIH